MAVLGALIVVAAVGYLAVCLLAGFGPAGTLPGFVPDNPPFRHRFRAPVETVVAAYRMAVTATPGMRLAAQAPGELLVDLRPTSRVIGGNFGLVIRLRFRADAGGAATHVETDSRNKVPFAFSNHHAAFEHAERALRTRAKGRAGLTEILEGIQ